ncbi:L-glyceraldehyde 3-phosphate reductase [Agrococcus sp. Marseille-P2731]|uniref:L-glyceraldehyde 3-phosphate reductase n=1 Tax=Agrococcus sp. Marseille-P2731 TaxID=1841862 RepID=UPI0009317E0A|nr:L-glyceraldehyde 3-phosphate reductase [Agrococcus sp. Marseille-P2731]
MSWQPDPARYETMQYRRAGASGLKLPALTLGLWHNFGDDVPLERQRTLLTTAFDRGITHFDLANNYGPPFGAAERNFGQVMSSDLAAHRDEILVTTKAGWDMWPGPYGMGGSRKYLVASLDQSLERMGLDYVDIFYHHRPDPETPLEETMGALDHIVRTGRALYVGVSSYSADETRRAHEILASLGTPLTIHQPSYSMLNRWIETDGLLDTAGELGIGVIGFTALAQGLLTGKYLDGVPADSRAARGGERKPLDPNVSAEATERIRGLAAIAEQRGQSLAQLALAWALRDDRMTSLTIGASRVEQLEQNLGALTAAPLTAEELAAIDELARDEPGVDLWAGARDSRS